MRAPSCVTPTPATLLTPGTAATCARVSGLIRLRRNDFSAVDDIRELHGTYVAAEAHAGAVKSSKAQAMTKGDVSLALAGTGKGWDLGVAFGAFTIEAR